MARKVISMTAEEIQQTYGKDEEKAIEMARAAPAEIEDINPGVKPIARGFATFKEHINRNGRPKVTDKKVVVSFRIPSSDAEKLRALGKGWQTSAVDYLVHGIRCEKIMDKLKK